MGIFRRNQIDLSDEGLALAAEESNANQGAAADERQPADESTGIVADIPDGSASVAADAPELSEQISAVPAAGLNPAEKAEREALWQEAAATIAGSWPQALGQGEMLIAKMVEISQRYGDPELWQRAPEGIMREAAIELYGLPLNRDNDYARAAAQSARTAALAEMNRRNQAKAGLDKRRGRPAPPAAMTEEEQIIEQISRAKGKGIF